MLSDCGIKFTKIIDYEAERPSGFEATASKCTRGTSVSETGCDRREAGEGSLSIHRCDDYLRKSSTMICYSVPDACVSDHLLILRTVAAYIHDYDFHAKRVNLPEKGGSSDG